MSQLETKKPGKREENRRRQIANISRAAVELFCRDGLETVTIDEIVAHAQIAKGSFYRYFKNKAELVEALFAPIASQIRNSIEQTQNSIHKLNSSSHLTRTYGVLATAVAAIIVKNLDVLRLYLQENRGPETPARLPIVRLSADIEAAARRMTEIAREQGLLRADTNAHVGTLASIGAIERLLLAYLAGDLLGSSEDVSSALIRVILDGVRAAPIKSE